MLLRQKRTQFPPGEALSPPGLRFLLEVSGPGDLEGDDISGTETFLLGDDITGSEYEAHEPWPGVPNVTLPAIFRTGMSDAGETAGGSRADEDAGGGHVDANPPADSSGSPPKR